MRIITTIVLMLLGTLLHADTVQWSQGYLGNCDNPTEREDGTPLLPAEIGRVEYYLDRTDGNITNPELTVIMTGGCSETFINTKAVGTGDYFAYGRVFDTDGIDSVASSPGVPKTIQKSRPKPATNFR